MAIAQRELPMGSKWEERFQTFHLQHPEVYKTICDKARILKRRGVTHYGVFALINVVRYHSDVSTDKTQPWRLNNNYAPYYARLIMRQEPDLQGFFELRTMKGEVNE